MNEPDLIRLLVLPIGLGLIGFMEPCSMGANLLFAKYVEGKDRAARLTQVGVFAITRGLFLGVLGLLAGLLGTAFLGLQKGVWVLLGAVYLLIGVLYVLGKAGALMRTIGPGLSRISDRHGSAGLGVLFGLNIPACAAPLIFVLLGTATRAERMAEYLCGSKPAAAARALIIRATESGVYSFLASILPYTNAEWEKLSIFLNFLVAKLPAPVEEDLSKGILEAIDMDSYRVPDACGRRER